MSRWLGLFVLVLAPVMGLGATKLVLTDEEGRVLPAERPVEMVDQACRISAGGLVATAVRKETDSRSSVVRVVLASAALPVLLNEAGFAAVHYELAPQVSPVGSNVTYQDRTDAYTLVADRTLDPDAVSNCTVSLTRTKSAPDTYSIVASCRHMKSALGQVGQVSFEVKFTDLHCSSAAIQNAMAE